jgi:hypothetical protein
MKKTSVKLADCIRVIANVHDLDTNRYFVELDFQNTKNERIRAIVPRRITSSGHLALRELLDLGAKLPTGHGAGAELGSCSASFLSELMRLPARRAGITHHLFCLASR